MKLHWKILIWLAAGVLVGAFLQLGLPAAPWVGLHLIDAPGGGARVQGVAPTGPAAEARIQRGDVITSISRGQPPLQEEVAVEGAEDAQRAIASARIGEILWVQVEGRKNPTSVTVEMAPDSARAKWIRPFAFAADLFMALLKMLIVPLILTSIITGVTGLGSGSDIRRLGLKTFGYYILTSFLAITLGLVVVNLIQPGRGAALGLRPTDQFEQVAQQELHEVILRMVPENPFAAMTDNAAMLQVIFFSLLFGFFITRCPAPHQSRLREFFESAFEVMMRLATAVLALIPYGVFALMAKVVGQTGFALFAPLGKYMLTVVIGLVLHAGVSLALLLILVGKTNPVAWAREMSPALLTAFSTSSSSMTLPVTMETVEDRGRISNRITSFVLPLGATINMDGTALYECVGVIFLAQYYASVGGEPLSPGAQFMVVLLALLASIGAAGVPSAGLVMMLTILTALGLSTEGAILLLAVDRPLDMLRTMVNVWSDTCGAAIIARTEGERPMGREFAAAA